MESNPLALPSLSVLDIYSGEKYHILLKHQKVSRNGEAIRELILDEKRLRYICDLERDKIEVGQDLLYHPSRLSKLIKKGTNQES